MKIFEDNRKFWQSLRPLFSDKQDNRNIIIIENNTVISNKTDLAEKFNNYYVDAVENLEIEHLVSSSMRMLLTRSSENTPHIPAS